MQRTPEEYKAAYLHHKNSGDADKAARVAQLYRQQLAGNSGAYQSPLPSPYANQAAAPQAKDGAFEGFGDAFYRGIDQPLENMGTTAEALGYDKTAAALRNATQAPPGQSPSAQFMNEGGESFDYKYLPKAAVEQSGQFIGSLATRAAGAGVGSVAGPGGAIVGGFAGPMLFEAAQQLGPIALERAKNNGRDKPNASDWEYAAGTSAGIGALNALAPGATGKLKRMLIEGITEGTQSVGEQVGTTVNTDKGLEVSARQALGEGIIGGSSAGIVDTSLGTIGAATNLVRGSNTSSAPADQEAAASFAQRLAEIAEANGYDLQDIDKMSSQGARETVDKAHIQYTEDLKQLFADLKSRVAVTDQDSLEEVAQKVLAAAAYREGRNKTKSTVGVQEMSALESLAGDTREGQEALSVLRQLNQLTKLHNDGYQGGVSAITDQFGPLGGKIGYDKGAVATERLLRPVISGSAAISTGGTSLIGQLALQGTGRMIDKVTGRRSVVDRFVKQNKGQSGIPGSTSPSLREESIAAEQAAAQEAEALQAQQEAQAQQQAQEEANLNEYVYNQGGLPNDKSPAGMMSSVLGIDPEQMMTMLDEIIATEPNPQIVDAAIAAQSSIVRGGQFPNLNQLISMMKLRVNPDPQFWIERDRSAGQAAAQTNLSRQEQNYQRGIENNQAFNQELQNAVDDDGSIPPLNKAHLKVALADLARDLGAQPLDMVNSIIERATEKGVTQEQMQAYLAPYLERVQQQQDAKNSRDQAAAEVEADPINENKTPVLQLDTSPSIIPVLNGTETPPKLSGKTEVARYLESRAKDRIGGVRDITNPEDRSAIADDMVAEAIYEMEQQDEGSAMDWYDSTIEKMLGMMALKYPEIETDIDAKTPMLIALSIMSQNMDVPTNLKIAEKAYEYYRDNGKFEIFGQGKSSAVMELNFEKANILLDKLGSMANLEKFLKTKYTVKDLNPVLQEYLGPKNAVGGENVDTEVYGSAVFGPKVGNGFYTNLRGDFSPVTMDMWFMRTVGRLRGKVLAFDEKKFQGQLDRLKNALGRKRMSQDELINKAFELIAKHEKDFKANRDLYDLPEGHPKRKEKSEATLAAYTIKGSLRDTVDAPASGTERNELRKLVQEAVEKFNAQTGLDIQPAAFQALIWYPEQDLYKSLGVQLKNVRKDFASSLKELLIKEGFDEAALNTAIDRVQQSREQRAGSVRQSSVGDDARTAGRRSPEVGRFVPQSTEPVNPAIKPGTGILSGAVSDYFKQPTPAQIKEQVEPAEQITKFVLGKPGSEFENGISTYDDLVDLANMLDVSVEIVSASKMQDKGSMGQMQALLEGTAGEIKIQSVKKLGPLEFMKTLAHEVSHALEGLSLDRLRSESVYKYNAHPQARGSQDVMRQGSLRSRLNEVIDLAFAKPGMFFQKKHDSTPSIEVSKKIVAEIDALQNGTIVGFADKPELGQQPMRENFPQFTRSMLEFNVPLPENASATQIAAREAEIAKMGSNGSAAEQIAKQFVGYETYIKETAEFGVDPLHFYLMDPKGMKKMMPETFKFMRDIFNKSSMPIEMHANPMMTVIALLLAGFGKALSGEEEEERPQGVLTPQPALLTT